jgi:DAK2 domain fusion protein YloV
MTDDARISTLSGPGLRDMFEAATVWLERNREQVNAINVFPVPDGDTGTNMFLTMRSTMEEAQKCPDVNAGVMMAAMAHGALMGARGNSGVILSQILRGVARAMEGRAEVDAAVIAAALAEGSDAAYRAVVKPVEGTILTVARESAEAAGKVTDGDLRSLLKETVTAARASVARTPDLLPVLAEAGVVDAGGQGFCVLLEGMLRYVQGESLEAEVAEAGPVEQSWLAVVEQRHEVESSPYGYCAEVLVGASDLDIDAVRERVLTLGDSVLVVGDDRLLRIHVHTDDPGGVLRIGTDLGEILKVKIDNINKQAESFVERQHAVTVPVAAPVPEGGYSCVAVASGEGLAAVFRGTGATQVVSGGPTMNPSTRELLAAIEACPSEDVIVLPNDKNIIMAAEQAVPLTKKRVRIVKSRSVPQGLAALLAANPEADADENAAAMEEALTTVRTVEITRAVRSTKLNGIDVAEGQAIAVVDDTLTLAAASPEDAAIEALSGLVGNGTALVTLYYGAETTEEQAEGLAARLRDALSGHDVDIVYGGQPHYQYIASLE